MTPRALLVAAFAVAAAMMGAPLLHAQFLPADSSAAVRSLPSLRLDFDRNVNTFNWTATGFLELRDSLWHGAARERFQRTLIKTERQSVKDEQQLSLDLERRLLPGLSVTAAASSFLFSDNQSLGLSDIGANRFLAGLRWQPYEALVIQPRAGAGFDRQQGVVDQGFTYDLLSSLERLSFGRSLLAGDLLLSESFLAPREQYERKIGARLATDFGAAGDNMVALQFRDVGRDFYVQETDAPASLDRLVESRTEKLLAAADQFRYQAWDNVQLLIGLDAQQRSIVKGRSRHEPSSATPFFDASIDEFRLTGNTDVRLTLDRGMVALRMEYFEKTETHAISTFDGASPLTFLRQQKVEEQKNNRLTQTQLGLALLHAFSSRDSASLSASTVKMRYDTPSPQNSDDRDELLLLLGARYLHRFSDAFTAFVSADVNLRHTVYIFSDQSANNTWNRVLRLAPGTELRLPDGFSSKLTGEVIANYTVYDFEAVNPSLRSYSLRQLTIADSTTLFLSRRVWLTGFLHFRLSERGELSWSAFTVRPMILYDERGAQLLLSHGGRSMSLSAGVRFFRQLRFRRSQAAWQEESLLESLGPLVRLRAGMGEWTQLHIDGWYQSTRQSGGETRTTPNLTVGVIWNL
jgi:hypothetical protein